MRIEELLTAVKKLDVVRQRKVAAVVGAAVADAAARPLHWVYDNNALQSYIRDVADTPEFFPENKSPFYSLPTGENSCYWDIAEASLTALATGGGYSYARVVEELVKSFGAGNGRYDLEARQEYMAKRREGKVDGPITGKWFHGAVIHFLKTYNNGIGSKPFGDPHEKATDGFCLAVPLVAGYAGTEQLGKVTREAIETMVTWPTAVQHGQVAARILEEMILRGEEYEVMSVVAEIAGKFPEVVRSVQAVEQVLDMEHTRAVNYVFGSPCYNPGSFQGALHAVLTTTTYAEAVRKTIRAGGCNCSRALFIGAMCGARYGISGIPVEWILATTNGQSILEKALKAYS